MSEDDSERSADAGERSPEDTERSSDSRAQSPDDPERPPDAAERPPDDTDASLRTRVRGRGLRVLDRLVGASVGERLVISLSALVLSIAVGTVLVYGAGLLAECASPAVLGSCYDPVTVYDELFLGAFGNLLANPTNGSFATTLSETTVLVFTGLSVAVAFRAGVFNIGTQGQMVVGGLATAVTVLAIGPAVSGLGVLAGVVALPAGLIAGAVVGGAYGAIPGALKAYADANEVITTIMLNFVATGVVLFLVRSRFQDPSSAATQTRPVPAFAQFPTVVFPERARLSLIALVAALVAAGVIAYLLAGTAFGFDLRTSGVQPAAAAYGGVDADRTVVAAMTLSGALGGLGGAVYVLMILGKFQTGVPAYGFDGITVSILAGNNPLGVTLSALLFGVLKSGSVNVDVATTVPPQLVGVLRGLIVLFVAMPEFFRMIGSALDRSSEPTAVTDGGRAIDSQSVGADGEDAIDESLGADGEDAIDESLGADETDERAAQPGDGEPDGLDGDETGGERR